MGENIVRATGLGRRRIAVAAAFAMAAAPTAAMAQKAPAPRDSGARASIVEFEEARGSRVVYLEQSGGMVTNTAKPAAAAERDDEPKKPAAKPMPRPMKRVVAPAEKP
jgi:hypothetical protein